MHSRTPIRNLASHLAHQIIVFLEYVTHQYPCDGGCKKKYDPILTFTPPSPPSGMRLSLKWVYRLKVPGAFGWKINQASPGRCGAASFVGKNRKIHPGNRKSLDGQAPVNKPHPPNKSICGVAAHFNPAFCLYTSTWRDTVGVMIYIAVYITRDQTLPAFFFFFCFSN